MRRVLAGNSGIMTGLDYRGVEVLAAYEPISILDLGLVGKMDISEIRRPFMKAGLIAFGTTILVIFIASRLFFRVSRPIENIIDKQAHGGFQCDVRLRGTDSADSECGSKGLRIHRDSQAGSQHRKVRGVVNTRILNHLFTERGDRYWNILQALRTFRSSNNYFLQCARLRDRLRACASDKQDR